MLQVVNSKHFVQFIRRMSYFSIVKIIDAQNTLQASKFTQFLFGDRQSRLL